MMRNRSLEKPGAPAQCAVHIAFDVRIFAVLITVQRLSKLGSIPGTCVTLQAMLEQ
jgi:hypothetical protein